MSGRFYNCASESWIRFFSFFGNGNLRKEVNHIPIPNVGLDEVESCVTINTCS